MTQKGNNPNKINILKNHGILNSNPEKIKHPLFHDNDFFDPHDLLQVKYEMIRQVEKDGLSVTQASSNFGYSRFSFYRILENFKRKGIAGLIPNKRGPTDGHKLSENIMDFVEKKMNQDSTYKTKEIKKIIEKQFGVKVHIRSLERAILRRKKNT